MKIFRGPSAEPLEDVSHELVAEIDIERSGSYVRDSVVLVANITKEPTERQAVAHLQLNAADLLALQQRMLTGLASKAASLELLEAKVAKASQALYALFEEFGLGGPPDYWEPEDRAALLADKLSRVMEAVGTLAYELDSRKRDDQALVTR